MATNGCLTTAVGDTSDCRQFTIVTVDLEATEIRQNARRRLQNYMHRYKYNTGEQVRWKHNYSRATLNYGNLHVGQLRLQIILIQLQLQIPES